MIQLAAEGLHITVPAVHLTEQQPHGGKGLGLALMAVYKALNWIPTGNVAVKLSTGEPPASNYLDPALIADVVHEVNGTIVECNTAYGGSRANTAMHYQVAEDHGFTAIADVVIMDENGSMTLPVTGGTRLTENYVGAHFADYDSFLVLSHFSSTDHHTDKRTVRAMARRERCSLRAAIKPVRDDFGKIARHPPG